MAKGAESKVRVMNKILETFDGSFLYNNNKEIRIPCEEDGQIVEIKVALTCAKTNVGGDSAPVESGVQSNEAVNAPTANIEPTEEEKQNIAELMSRLGL